MDKFSLTSIIFSSFLLLACGGSSNSSNDNQSLSAPSLPAINHRLSTDSFEGVWLLSYSGTGSYKDDSSSIDNTSAGKVLAVINKEDDRYHIKSCGDNGLGDLAEWPLVFSQDTLSYSNNDVLIDTQENTSASFSFSNNQSLIGMLNINFIDKEVSSTNNNTLTFSGVKVSDSTSIASATEISSNMMASGSNVVITEAEIPLDCFHLSVSNLTSSGFQANEIAGSASFYKSDDIEGGISATAITSNSDAAGNAYYSLSELTSDIGDINHIAKTDCEFGNFFQCKEIESLKISHTLDQEKHMSLSINSTDIEGNVFTANASITIQ